MQGRTMPAYVNRSALAVTALVGVGLLAGCSRPTSDIAAGAAVGNSSVPAATAAPAPAPDPVERGRYLVAVGGCNDCHTPFKMGPKGPEPDMAQMLSGHPASAKLPPPPRSDGPWVWHGSATNTAFAGPWGVSYAPNLTPDEDTGLGAWTEHVFVSALRTGKHLGFGRPILPPMPWQGYAQMTDDDLKAVFAYLKTVPPRKNKVPEAVLAGPPPTAS
jgi:mono/diheme cytochrome c family protein